MKNVHASGALPMNDNYKLLLKNVFSLQELGVMSSALASSLKSLMEVNKHVKKKFDVSEQIQTVSIALGKVLLSIPEETRVGLLQAFSKDLGLEFHLSESETPELTH